MLLDIYLKKKLVVLPKLLFVFFCVQMMKIAVTLSRWSSTIVPQSTIVHMIFKTGSSFHMKWRISGEGGRGGRGVEMHACMSYQDPKLGLLISCEIVCYSSIYQKSHVQALWEFAEIQKIYPPTSSTSIWYGHLSLFYPLIRTRGRKKCSVFVKFDVLRLSTMFSPFNFQIFQLCPSFLSS